MLTLQMRGGERIDKNTPEAAIKKARAVASSQLEYLDASYKRILNPHIYKVSITEELKEFKMSFIKDNIDQTQK